MNYRASWPELANQTAILYMRFLYRAFGWPPKTIYGVAVEEGESVEPLLDVALKGAEYLYQMPEPTPRNSSSGKGTGKKDFEAHQRKCKRIGDRGEALVLALEQKRLFDAGKPDLANRIDHVSQKEDLLGYDILSYDEDGTERFIEVKATTSKNLDRGFFISANELEKAKSLSNYYIYFVFSTMSATPQILRHKEPSFKGDDFVLSPVAYHVALRTMDN